MEIVEPEKPKDKNMMAVYKGMGKAARKHGLLPSEASIMTIMLRKQESS